MAKGAARDAKQKTQKLSIELPTDTFITLGDVLDPDFKVTREDTEVKRPSGIAQIHPIEVNTDLVEKWIVDVVRVEADKAYEQKQKERQALLESMKDELIAQGWTPPKGKSKK